MNFWARVASDNNDITNETGAAISLVSPCGVKISIIAVSRDIAQLIDSEYAVSVTVRNINARISIKDLEAENYPFKSDKGGISLSGHKVEIQFPNGEISAFEITDFRPDMFFGNINLVLDRIGQRPQVNKTSKRFVG